MNKNNSGKGGIFIAIGVILFIVFFVGSCSGQYKNSSSYQLHNKDGSLNWNYIQDMQDYFKANPDELPK